MTTRLLGVDHSIKQNVRFSTEVIFAGMEET